MLQHVSMNVAHNRINHRTEGLESTSLVVRRGQPFQLTLVYDRPYDPRMNEIRLRLHLGTDIKFDVPVTFERKHSPGQWCAYYERNIPDQLNVCVSVFSPADATIAVYRLDLVLMSFPVLYTHMVGNITLLCNPWCTVDSVFLPDESQRDEYVRRDFGMVYQGTAANIISRPWNFDLYESEILDICMRLLCVSPESLKNKKTDFVCRKDPVYISRVVSAMINANDDLGVLDGRWSNDFKDGVNPSSWTGSGYILKKWSKSGCKPVKYGQCWVFAAVMCTVMRVLGIPARVVTNYNSGHDTNANLLIEENYNEKGEKLPGDSIWNFHVWVECWMKRKDLCTGFDGWQVLDPTPQERSEGNFQCGPAPVKAIREQRVDVLYDVPFVYAEVNASVQVNICRGKKVLSYIVEKNRLGTFICTKSLGSNKPMNITASYKNTGIKDSQRLSRGSSLRSHCSSQRSSIRSRNSRPRQTMTMGSGFSVSLIVHRTVVGENIQFFVTITNNGSLSRTLREHVNAQAKSYNSLLFTFWEAQKIVVVPPRTVLNIPHEIPHNLCMALGNEQLVNLAAVVTDVETHESLLAFEEFNMTSPSIQIEFPYRTPILTHHAALVKFTNPFLTAINGLLTVTGSSMMEGNELLRYSVQNLKPRQTLTVKVHFTPKMAGEKMLHARLELKNIPTVIHGFTTIMIQ